MEFTEFVQLMKPIIGGSYSTYVFTKTLFDSILTDDGASQIEDISGNTFKAYYNGNTKITKIAQRILPHIEPEQFISYLDDFQDATSQRLCDAFKPYIADINSHNSSEKIAYFFESILADAASQKRKSTPKSAKNNDANDIIKIPTEQIADEYPYSTEDKMLLEEFNSDYDEILLVMVGENYGVALLDMSLPRKLRDLYTEKWNKKSNTFSNLTLKSNIFALLGELNQLSDSLLIGRNEPFFIRQARLKIRNLYVKLHPDSFSATFPYDTFIEDWDEGEF